MIPDKIIHISRKFLNFSLLCSCFYVGVFAFITRILHHLAFLVQRPLVEMSSTAQKGALAYSQDYSLLKAPCIDGLGLKGLKGGLRCQYSVRFESRFKLRGKHHQDMEPSLNAILVLKNNVKVTGNGDHIPASIVLHGVR